MLSEQQEESGCAYFPRAGTVSAFPGTIEEAKVPLTRQQRS